MTKKKQTHRYREQTRGYQWGQERGRDNRGRGLRGTNYYVWNNIQGYIVQHGDYSQYFIMTINGV